ncbi:M4 family metallopeptidase, partial [Salmonella enterica]|nr:M4 family metallopeptidase [Salmonella enterica]
SAIDEAFSDIFTVFFNNHGVSGDAVDWDIGRGYSRTGEAIRYVDSPKRDGAVENIHDITPSMNPYQRGGFIRKMFYNLYNNLRASGFDKNKSLELSYMLFYDANEDWHKGMSFGDLTRSLYTAYMTSYTSTYNEKNLLNAMSDVGVSPEVQYKIYSKAGFV